MDSSDLHPSRSADLSVERLESTASAPALQGRIPEGEAVPRKKRRSSAEASNENDEFELLRDQPDHKLDRLA